MNRTVCVTGATGKQGWSVCSHLVQAGFKVRGTTRNEKSENAMKLQELGVEMVKANMGDQESLRNAFKGCWAVFAVTDFYQDEVKKNPELEFIQGKHMVDAAVEASVEYFVFSSLDDVATISKGALHVPHFSNKYRVAQYARTKTAIKSIFVLAGVYMQNFSDMMPAIMNDKGEVVFSFPFNENVKIPLVDITDTGKLVSAILKNNPEQLVGKEIFMCGENISLKNVVDTFTATTGVKGVYREATEEAYRAQLPADIRNEFIDMFKWFRDFGYYGGRDVDSGIAETNRILGRDGMHMTTWQEYLHKSGFKGVKSPSFLEKAATTIRGIADTVTGHK